MPNSDLDVQKLRKYVKDQLDNVTCINCCKYYQVATTAPCGHSLCQTCFKGRHTCPLCALRIDKKALRLNSPLQSRTEHAIMLRETFESLFDKQLDDFTLNTDQPQHVKEWLANSRNQFSVPITSSSEFTEETAKPLHHITSEIQIHTRNEKLKQPERKTITMNIQQDDWDKIEEMPEVDTIKSHENPVGPMDIETFDFLMDDKDYNANNPRRSLRNKQEKNNKPPKNVKRRGNKYNKLSKENQNKLNISIEMCKKANLAATKKAPSKSLQGSSDGITPKIAAPDDAAFKNTDFNNDNRNDTENFKYLPTSAINTNKVISNKMQNNSSLSHSQDIKQKGIDLQTKTKENIEQLNQNALTSKISFFKRGPLKATFLDKNNTHVNNPIVKNKNNDKVGTDDINITIKIGNILTNINIEKKENDVKLKINNNREVQTSLDNCNNKDEYNMRSSENDPNTQRIETTTNNIVVKVYKDVAVCTEHSISKVQLEKSLSTKKNTTSAETSTAQFEITESEEREFADHMDNIPLLNKKDENELSKLGCTSKSKQDKQLSFKLDAIPSDLEFLNDFDVFDSESVKEDNIQQLKPAKSTPSVILMSTVKGKSTSQRNINKRSYVSDTEDTSNTKKIRKSQESFEVNKITPETLLKENDILDEESENINDDANMSQVFASTNADMDLQKTGTSTLLRTQISNTLTSNHNNIAEFSKSNIKKQDILKKTNGEQTNQGANQKCSEIVFSLSGKEGNSEILKTKNYKPFGQTQQLEVKSLAPEGGCDRAIENKEKLSSQNNMDLIEFCTPIQDDDDKSIVEETPQKTTSFLKNRVKKQTKTLNEDEAAAQCSSAINDKSSNDARDPRQDPDKDDSLNVICASDADEITEGRKSVSETPLTITKFAEKISHRSTPLAKRSLDMSRRNAADDPEETLCPSSVVAAKTTQEREFMSEAFERSQTLGAGAPCVAGSCAGAPCVAGSCLAPAELAALRQLCARRGWRYVDKYTTDLTHLVVGVDEDNQSQRSVKYMCAVAGSKWIVSFAWVEKCLHVNGFVDEEPYEALDSSGEPGPRRARLARAKLLHGITFYCMPPFTIIDIQTLKGILEAAGGRVVGDPGALRASVAPAMLLAEPESTQEDRFIYLAMELKIVPMNYEWVVNCLGTYTLKPIFDLLLCPAALLTTVVSNWPAELISSCDE